MTDDGDGGEIVVYDHGEVEYLLDSRIGTADPVMSDGGTLPSVFVWEVVVTPTPGEGEPTARRIILTQLQLAAVGKQVAFLLDQ